MDLPTCHCLFSILIKMVTHPGPRVTAGCRAHCFLVVRTIWLLAHLIISSIGLGPTTIHACMYQSNDWWMQIHKITTIRHHGYYSLSSPLLSSDRRRRRRRQRAVFADVASHGRFDTSPPCTRGLSGFGPTCVWHMHPSTNLFLFSPPIGTLLGLQTNVPFISTPFLTKTSDQKQCNFMWLWDPSREKELETSFYIYIYIYIARGRVLASFSLFCGVLED